jgi:hypothetical protein
MERKQSLAFEGCVETFAFLRKHWANITNLEEILSNSIILNWFKFLKHDSPE